MFDAAADPMRIMRIESECIEKVEKNIIIII